MRLFVLLVVLGLAGAITLWLRHDGSSPKAPQPEPAIDAPKQTPARPVVLSDPAPEAAPKPDAAAEHGGWIAYPDGSARPPLNGVTAAPKLVWHRMIPFTPVVSVERDATGRDWYVHENGARSTTYVDARGMPMTDIRMPMPAMPAVDAPVSAESKK